MSALLDPRRYPTRLLILIVLIGALLFGASFLVEVRIILVSPEYGDVTDLFELLWRAVLGLTTIGSFAIAAYNLRFSDQDDVEGPATNVVIKGENNEVKTLNVYPTGEERTIEGDVPDRGAMDEERPPEDSETGDRTAADQEQRGEEDETNGDDGQSES